MGRIEETFAQLKQSNHKALIPFITAGDPDMDTTEKIIATLVDAGADLIELGVPFSDPMADGPTIQAASERALAAGATLDSVLDLVERVRSFSQVPIVLMGYYNPVFCYGLERFADRAAQVGVDGLLLVDLPAEEREELHIHLKPKGVHLITLLAPTTPPDRAAQLMKQAQGFVYYVSMTGVTGTSKVDGSAIESQVVQLRAHSPVPVAVGFGITTEQDAAAIARFSDAVVVGSALVKVIQQHAKSPCLQEEVRRFVAELKQGVSRATDLQ
ncbi:tryptophan synthase subunit alpha [uncultured Desulfuromonas sp.]|uniref:tryptophan synthase subunit alpha n=1 Tax=uncultured Desulfuromonas sp. TaxID=181013 RepID=UPI002AAA86BF|nr:tryptophan synthase subunit alpha [uncultured Desulfuromonas sp.]